LETTGWVFGGWVEFRGFLTRGGVGEEYGRESGLGLRKCEAGSGRAGDGVRRRREDFVGCGLLCGV
jgi:hypothetical protein